MIRILLVDDDKFLLDMYAKKFQGSGFEVETAESGDDALAKIKGGLEVDVIATDATMPGTDGFSFLETMKKEEIGGGAIKIMLTNQNTEEEMKRAEQAGVDEYIIKATMIPSEVVEAVTKIVANHTHTS